MFSHILHKTSDNIKNMRYLKKFHTELVSNFTMLGVNINNTSSTNCIITLHLKNRIYMNITVTKNQLDKALILMVYEDFQQFTIVNVCFKRFRSKISFTI